MSSSSMLELTAGTPVRAKAREARLSLGAGLLVAAAMSVGLWTAAAFLVRALLR